MMEVLANFVVVVVEVLLTETEVVLSWWWQIKVVECCRKFR